MISQAVTDQLRRFPQFNQMLPMPQGGAPDLVTQAIAAARPQVSRFIHSPYTQLGGLAALAIPSLLHGEAAPAEEVAEEAGPLLREPPPMYQAASPAGRALAEQRLITGWKKGFADYLGSNWESLTAEQRNRINAVIPQLLAKVRQGQPIGNTQQIFRDAFSGFAEQRAGEVLGPEK